MNIMQMMKQAQGLQKRLKDTQAELANLEVVGEKGGVKVVCDGQGKFKSIKISPEVITPDDPEMLEDVISTAIKQANEKASAEMSAKMKQITGGISIPGLNF